MNKTKYKFNIGEQVFVHSEKILDELSIKYLGYPNWLDNHVAGKKGIVISRKAQKRDGARVEKYTISDQYVTLFSWELYSLRNKLEMLDEI